jgi:hypothetical protein
MLISSGDLLVRKHEVCELQSISALYLAVLDWPGKRAGNRRHTTTEAEAKQGMAFGACRRHHGVRGEIIVTPNKAMS